MSFPIHFPCTNLALSQMQLNRGEMLFVLGANGVGKSSLMHRFTNQNRPNVRKIAAHRQTWMSSDTLDMTPSSKAQTQQNILNEDAKESSRYKDIYAAQRASMTIFELIDAENVRARAIASDVDSGQIEAAKQRSKTEAPIAVINELLRLSNIPIAISIRTNEKVVASKEGGPEYSAAQLSDGERNALLIAGEVLTAPLGNLIIIDEPERHLHRSIISPLLSQLFERRPDCAFIVSTHDHDLPLGNPQARTLLVRSCNFNGQNVQTWDADELGANATIDDVLKRDLLGARRKMLFVEGTESSLDKPLYSLIFPNVSVISKGSCRDVEQAVHGVTSGAQFHWLRAFGIVDGDGLDHSIIQTKSENGIYALPYYSVEAIYFHPKIISMIACAQAGISGDDAEHLIATAIQSGIDEVRLHSQRLCQKAVKKAVGRAIEEQLPAGETYLVGVNINIQVDSEALMSQKIQQLTTALDTKDWETVLSFCPIRECGARDKIARSLNFKSVSDYQKAVLHLLTKNSDAVAFVRSLFATLHSKLME